MKNPSNAKVFGILTQMGEAICRTIGTQCEVAIHDLTDMERSIVWIMGDVTERKIGGCMTSRGLSLVRSGKTNDSYNYTTRTRSGKLVRCSMVFLKSEKGRVFACIEINFNTSAFVAFQPILNTLADPKESYDFNDAFIDDAPQMLETMIMQAIEFTGKSTTQMNKADRVRVVQILDEAGAFEMRKAVPAVAGHLNVTRFTIHNYLNEIRGNAADDTD